MKNRKAAFQTHGAADITRRATIWIALLAASLHISHCYVALSSSWMDMNRYAAGTEPMPYQGRMLMMYPIRWAEHNALLVRFCSHHVASARDPALLLTMVVSFLCILGTAATVKAMYSLTSNVMLMPYLPVPLFLVIAIISYILHADNNFLYPYDFPSLFLFTLAILFTYQRRFLLLLATVAIASFNRETIIFIVPIFLLDACCEAQTFRWKRMFRAKKLMQFLALLGVWVAATLYVHYRFRFNPTELGSHFHPNLAIVCNPIYWPQLCSVGGFALLYILVSFRLIKNYKMRKYLWVLPLWAATMFVYGNILETRIFGELSGLIAIWFTLILESTLDMSMDKREGYLKMQSPVATQPQNLK